MIELADAVLSLCKLLKNAQWNDPGCAFDLGVIAADVERLITEELKDEPEFKG